MLSAFRLDWVAVPGAVDRFQASSPALRTAAKLLGGRIDRDGTASVPDYDTAGALTLIALSVALGLYAQPLRVVYVDTSPERARATRKRVAMMLRRLRRGVKRVPLLEIVCVTRVDAAWVASLERRGVDRVVIDDARGELDLTAFENANVSAYVRVGGLDGELN